MRCCPRDSKELFFSVVPKCVRFPCWRVFLTMELEAPKLNVGLQLYEARQRRGEAVVQQRKRAR